MATKPFGQYQNDFTPKNTTLSSGGGTGVGGSMADAGVGGATGWGSQYPRTPPGYQPPDISAPGFPVQTPDQRSAAGAPAGYEWDPVQQKYVPKVASATTALSVQDQLRGLMTNSTSSSSSSGTGAGSGTGSTSGFPTIPYPAGGGPGTGGGYGQSGGATGAYPQIAQVDTRAAEDAAFNRAKDKSGLVAQSALSGLRSSLGGRGLLGSGAESRGTAAVINKGQGELGDVIRQNAITSSEAAQQNAIANYQGQVGMRGQDVTANTAMRGQDIGERETQYQGGITQRGQDISALSEQNRNALLQTQLQFQKQQMALEALKGLVPGITSTLQY